MLADQVQARTAEELFAALGDLKGGAMKVGQWLSAMEAALPERVAGPYGDALTRLQEAAPALPVGVIHQVLDQELGSHWRFQLLEFDDSPAAAASVGQVHRARWHDGRDVAVKVQYPRAREALAVDLRQLDRLTPLMRLAAPGVPARELFAALRESVLAETDYEQESVAQTEFSQELAEDPDFVVPPVVEVTPRVLVSEWVDGTALTQVARTGSQQQRDRAGELLVRFLLASPLRVGRLHGDPHPGNFRLSDDGRLVVLDFGSTLALPDGWPRALGELLRVALDRDPGRLESVMSDAGLITPGKVTGQQLLEVLDPLLAPLRVDRFTFSRRWLRGETVRFSDPRGTPGRVQRHLHVPARYMLVQRVLAGTTGVLCSLGARVPVRDEARTWLAGFDGPLS
jgi:predicted unusual protein kinase regulating ubiquinone biosynthesis (AarF/ABC1/UbiB family)